MALLVKRHTYFLPRECGNVQPTLSPVKLTLTSVRLARAQISGSTFYEFSKSRSSALRLYIRLVYKIPSSRVTTEEIISKLLSKPQNDRSLISLLTEVLTLTDGVKYSKRTLSTTQQRGIYKKACKFVLLSERFFRSPKGIAKS
jgi:hypothetical protein